MSVGTGLLSLMLGAASASAEGETSNISSRTLTGVTLTDGNTNASAGVYVVNIADCQSLIDDNTSLTFSWTLANTPLSGAKFGIKLEAPGSTCSRTTPAFDSSGESNCEQLAADQDLSEKTESVQVNARDLFSITDANACLDGTTGVGDYRVYFIFTDPTNTSTEVRYDYSPIRVALDTTRPTAPSIRSVEAGGSSIVVRVSNAEDDMRYRAYYSTDAFTTGVAPETLSGVSRSGITSSSTVRIEGGSIRENETYYVALVAVDSIGNESFVSAAEQVTTTPTTDFWEEYHAGGGVEQGGYCAAGGPTAPAKSGMLLALLGLVAARRTRRGKA